MMSSRLTRREQPLLCIRIAHGPEYPQLLRVKTTQSRPKTTRGPPHRAGKERQITKASPISCDARRYEHLNPLEAIPNSPRNNGSVQP